MSEETNNAQAIIEFAKFNVGAEVLDLEHGTHDACGVLILPQGKKAESIKKFLDEYLPVPERKKGIAKLTQLETFIAFTQRHKTEHSVVFLDDHDPAKPTLRVVFNPHGASDAAPGWADFGASYAFPVSDEWTAWTKLPGDLNQAAFAAFLEDRVIDVLDPAEVGEKTKRFADQLYLTLAGPGRMMELSRGLSITVDQQVTQILNTNTGESQLNYTEQHKESGGKALKIPNGLAIGIPVFRLDSPYQLVVRLRYRMSGQRVMWTMALQGAEKVFEHAISEAITKVVEQTGLPVFRGSL